MSSPEQEQEMPNNELLEVFRTVLEALPDSQIVRLHNIIYNVSNGLQVSVMDRFVRGHRQYKYAVQREEKALRRIATQQNELESKSLTIVKLREELMRAEHNVAKAEATAFTFEKRFKRLAESKVILAVENSDGQE